MGDTYSKDELQEMVQELVEEGCFEGMEDIVDIDNDSPEKLMRVLWDDLINTTTNMRLSRNRD